MAKKLEEECGTKVLMNVPEVDQVDLSAFSEEKAKETRRFHESIPAYNRTPLVQLRGLWVWVAGVIFCNGCVPLGGQFSGAATTGICPTAFYPVSAGKSVGRLVAGVDNCHL